MTKRRIMYFKKLDYAIWIQFLDAEKNIYCAMDIILLTKLNNKTIQSHAIKFTLIL